MWIKRVRTLLIEIAIGLAMVATAILYATYGPFRWLPHRKWISLAILTSGVWGVAVWWYRERWRQPILWVAMTLLFALHIGAYYLVLIRLKEFPPLLSALSCPLELLVILPILGKATN